VVCLRRLPTSTTVMISATIPTNPLTNKSRSSFVLSGDGLPPRDGQHPHTNCRQAAALHIPRNVSHWKGLSKISTYVCLFPSDDAYYATGDLPVRPTPQVFTATCTNPCPSSSGHSSFIFLLRMVTEPLRSADGYCFPSRYNNRLRVISS